MKLEATRQNSENWLDPNLSARISCHELNWTNNRRFNCMQTGGSLFFHQIPYSGTMLHTHDFSEILLVNNGSVVHHVNGEKQLLMAGDICFLRPDDEHGFLPNDKKEQCEIVMLDFDLELFLSLSIYFENDDFLKQLTAPVLPPCFRVDPNTTNQLYNRLLKLNTLALSPLLRKIQLKILLGELFSKFFINESILISESQIPDWLENLCIMMKKEENFIIGLPKMQKLACRTPGHLCKSFQKYLNKTPTEFINELRISHAAFLLDDERSEIAEIAERLNFQSLSRFYHLFKAYHGMSPAAYRKLHAGNRKF